MIGSIYPKNIFENARKQALHSSLAGHGGARGMAWQGKGDQWSSKGGSDVTKLEWHERAQFFAMAAQLMRRILVDAARARAAHKRGGSALKVNLDETALLSSPQSPQEHRVVERLPVRVDAGCSCSQ